MRILTAEEIEALVDHETQRALKTLRGKNVPRVYGQEIENLQRLRIGLYYARTASIENVSITETHSE